MNHFKSKLNQKGQSLVEVIVACGLLTVVLVAIMSVSNASRNLLFASQDQTKATTLAQEGVEIVQHQRDIGCSFNNIKTTDGTGELQSNIWYIKGDDGTNDETLITTPPTFWTGGNFKGFSRTIKIYDLKNSTTDDVDDEVGNDILLNDFQPDTGNPANNYDTKDKYYFIKVKVTGPNGVTSTVSSIISKQ